MANILLVEPNYRSKFPPLGLLRISSYHKEIGDNVTFVRGCDSIFQQLNWHKIYISSLFTYELPRTVRTIKYYIKSVESENDVVVGGIGATLMPEYIKDRVSCRVISGPLTTPRRLANEKKPIAKYLPDYSLIDSDIWSYLPSDSYFCRVTTGCIRKCKFCAVPVLEPKFKYLQPLNKQVAAISEEYGKRQHLVLLDNNILACDKLEKIVADIRRAGFEKGTKRNRRKRDVDFNQGIDARLVTKQNATLLSSISVHPIRLAFDYIGIEKAYVNAIRRFADQGFKSFTNYVMFNFQDNPEDFYYRIRKNAELSEELDVRVSGFPMRYKPITDVTRKYVSPNWKWRYLRGIQCVLLATRGLVSPNLNFFNGAFGTNYDKFIEILCMPDRYIIHREKYASNGAGYWRRSFNRMIPSTKSEFLDVLEVINKSRTKERDIAKYKKFRKLLEHYYPGGRPVECK